jgi:hypothetical protein
MFRIFAFGVLLSLLACGGMAPDGQGGSRSPISTTDRVQDREDGDEARKGDRDDCHGHVEFRGVSERIEAQLNIARRAVCKYRFLDAALATDT